MEMIFEPNNEQEKQLVDIIKNNPEKATRKKALVELLKINGFDKNELYAIRSIEVYKRIPNKPPTWKTFSHAVIMYNNLLLKR